MTQHNDLNYTLTMLQVEGIDAETADLMMNNPEASSQAHEVLGKLLNIFRNDTDILVQLDENIENIEYVNRILGSFLPQTLRANLANFEAAPVIYSRLLRARAIALSRIGERAKKEEREDDADIATILKRLSAYDSTTAVPAREMGGEQGVRIIPGAGTPSEAIEAYVRARIEQINPNYDFSSPKFKILLEKMKTANNIRVLGRVEA